MKLDDLEVPATPACRAALEVATAYCSPALLNHSVRAYLWAAGYGLEARHRLRRRVALRVGHAPRPRPGEGVRQSQPCRSRRRAGTWPGCSARQPGGRWSAANAPPRSSCGTCGTRWTSRRTPRVTSSNSRPPWTSRGGAPRIFPRTFVPTCLPGIHDSASARNSSGTLKTRRSASPVPGGKVRPQRLRREGRG